MTFNLYACTTTPPMNSLSKQLSLRHLLLFLILFLGLPNRAASQEEILLVSWNIRDLGKSKSNQEIERIADIVKSYDIVAIQEVVAGYGGAQAVARLADELNRKGSRWDYSISNPTSSPKYKTERYAYLWKTSRVKIIGKARLIHDLAECVYREPYRITLRSKNNSFTIINYHSRKYSEQPQVEISCISNYIMNHATENMILAGDFNLPITDPVFEAFKKQKYRASLSNIKTTLKRKCKERKYLHHAIDNIFYNSLKNDLIDSGTIDFIKQCERLESMRKLSDHLPVFINFTIRALP